MEPSRVPPPASSAGERAASGCLGLFVLPWFMTSVLFGFISAGMPLASGPGGGTILGILMLALFIPMMVMLGGVTISAFQFAAGKSARVQLSGNWSAALVLSVVAIFLLSVLTSILSTIATGTSSFIASVGILIFLGLAARSVWQQYSGARKRQKQRRRHERPPKPPWSNPLARTERTNMLSEAVANQYNVIALFALVALSIIMWNPMPALIGGGLELFYLALMPDTKWFRRHVDAKHREWAEAQAHERREEQLQYVTEAQVNRHHELVAIAESAKSALATSRFPFDVAKLDRVIDHHLWLMELENYYADQDDPDRLAEVERTVESTEAELTNASGRMREMLDRRLHVLHRRRDQLRSLGEQVARIREQRRSLEDTLRLVAESALSSPGADAMEDLDEVLFELNVAEEVVLDLHDEEDALEREIEEAVARAS